MTSFSYGRVYKVSPESKKKYPLTMDNKTFVSDALEAHNKCRAKHGVPALTENKELTRMAQNWAEHLASKDVFKHSDDKHQGQPIGENIAMKFSSSGDEFTGQAVTDMWYSEIVRFDFDKASGPRTGHFSQVVWKGSREFGIGRARSAEGKWLVVGNFFPAGNYHGQYKDNVMPPVNGKIEVPETEKKPSGGDSFNNFPSTTAPTSSGGTRTSRSTRTETTRGPDGKTITKTIVTETTIDARGNKSVKTTESVKES